MCIDTPGRLTILCMHYLSFNTSRTYLSTPFWEFVEIICHFPSGRTAPVLGFRLAVFPRIVELTELAPEVCTYTRFPAMYPFVSRTFSWRILICESLTVWFDPKFPFSRRKDFLSELSWDTNPNWMFSFFEATDPFPSLFISLILICPPAPLCLKLHSSPNLHPDFRLVSVMREGTIIHLQVLCKLLQGFLARYFWLSVQKNSLFLEHGLHKAFFRQSVSSLSQ